MGSAFNGSGQTTFSANASNYPNSRDLQTRNGVWVNRAGSVEVVALQGKPAPGTSQKFGTFDFYPQMNSAGHIAFGATLAEGGGYQNGIWSDVSGTLQKVAAIGDQAPGFEPGVKFDLVGPPMLSNSDRLVFTATLQRDGSSVGAGFWSLQNGTYELIFRDSDPVPGAPPEDKFGGGGNKLTMNHLGRIAFLGSLQVGFGDANSSNHFGIWAEDQLDKLRLIVRTGDTIDVDSGPGVDLRTIASLNFFGNEGSGPSSEGHQSGFNDLGQIAFMATFTDGSSGVFLSNLVAVPEPEAISLVVLFLLCSAAARSRSRVGTA
jgi:hypothetical protein